MKNDIQIKQTIDLILEKLQKIQKKVQVCFNVFAWEEILKKLGQIH